MEISTEGEVYDSPQYEGGGLKKQKSSTSGDKKIGAEKNNKGKNTSMTGSQKGENSVDGSVAPANKSQVRQKKPMKRIQRYESNSIDEEEFQDYFTNPIKRKEFDRQRKKQQMREMQNITGFTLGNFGIKSAKAMKEALPPYPENDETNVNNEQKNYATVSLCCLSVTNPFRNKIIQIVAVNPAFDRFILVVIVINCVFLALDQENQLISDNSSTIDLGFLIIYTGEMVLKIIAMGFFMRAHSYLRDAWNILDFMVVILGWLAIIFENSGDISAIKVIRILRPLRTINQIPNMSSLVSTILNSLPIMFDVMVLFFFMLIMFGTIATQLLGGSLQNRCWAPDKAGIDSIDLGEEQIQIICIKQFDCDDEQPPGVISTCKYYGNPISGTYQFDNILMSILNIFQIITLENWTHMMYIVRDAQRSKGYDPFFILIVILGSFVILNLMIAVQAAYLDQEFNEEANRIAETQEKQENKKKMQQNQDDDEEGDEEEEEEVESESDVDGKPGRRKNAKKEKSKGLFECKLPEWFNNLSNKLESIALMSKFERGIIILILLNTLCLASEQYEQSEFLTEVQTIANYFFTGIFAVEMIVKMVGFGIPAYVKDNFNIFDCFIVCMSFVELLMPDSDSSLSVLRAFRLLRIFKIIKSWDSLRVLLSTVLDSLQAITNLGVLIILFLFISALLTKQFYTGQLLTEDGDPSRYNFGTTGDALISVFIILTGENWNEIMVQVIDKEDSKATGIFFCILMILGNFMLLNLFLAILLKSISEIGDGEADEAAEKKDGEEEPEEACGSDAEEGINDSGGLNSSNSNIEEEFEQIKLQLMALSNNMNGLLDGNKDGESDDEASHHPSDASEDSDAKKKQKEQKKSTAAKERAKQAIFSSQQVIAMEQAKTDTEALPEANSLCIFAPDSVVRRVLRQFISNSYFAGFIYHMIALNSLLLTLDQPSLEDKYQKKTIEEMLFIISWIFIIECVVKVIVHGFYWGEKTYIKDPWNVLDFIIVIFSVLTMILVELIDEQKQGNIQFIRGFRALRALRPLRVVSKNEGIKTVVNSLILSIPALLNVLLIVLLFLLVFGILGIQLFKGKMGLCNDKSPKIQTKSDCVGFFYDIIKDENGVVVNPDEKIERVWETPFNNYNNILYSMMTFFEIATLEMWPDMMYAAIDSTKIDHVPKLDNNKFISLIFIIYIFFTTFFIMNLFISVIVDKFNEEIKKRQGADNFTDEQKEWVKIQRLLVHTNPKIIPVEPINCFRLQCFKIVQSQAFEYIIMTAIVINTIFLCIDYYDKGPELSRILENANWIFVIFFTGEMLIKITAYGIKYYWYVNWNKFDCIIVIMSLVALDESALEDLNFNVTALRIIRVSRLLRMVKTSEGLRTLLKTLFMSLGNIINTAGLLSLILFTFSVAGMSLFGPIVYVPGGFINKNVNFRSFYDAMLTLWRAATGESWNGIMHECYDSQGFVAIVFWLMYQLMTFFIFMNVFIAVIGESFGDNQATEDENDILALKKKDIKAFQNTWAKYNPMGELYMRTIRLPDFLRELPPPLGYQGIRIEESKLNKIIFCLNIRDHHGRVYYPEVMWTIFHSIAGMNDDKVLNCEQITNILKLVKNKYKGLGKKVNLDSLCGNKYYRKELTAIKYIQAMKILYKWRNFKNVEQKRREQMNQLAEANKNGMTDSRKPLNVSPVGNTPHPNNDAGHDDSDGGTKLRAPQTNLPNKYFSNKDGSESEIEPSGREDDESQDRERQIEEKEGQEHIKAQRLRNIKNSITQRTAERNQRNRQEQAAANNDGGAGRGGSGRQPPERQDNINGSYDEDDEQEQRQANPSDGQSSDDDMNGITERNAQSARNKQLGRAPGGGAPKEKTRANRNRGGESQGVPGRSGKKANRYANDYGDDSEPVDHTQIKVQTNKNRRNNDYKR